jgi:hypothetical protein
MTKPLSSYIGAPKTLKVGAFDYKVSQVPKLVNDDGTESWGQIVYEDYEITVQSLQPSPSVAVDTLLHELLHAVWHNTDLRGEIGKNLEERVIRNLTSGLVALFRDNPQLLKWIVKRLSGK